MDSDIKININSKWAYLLQDKESFLLNNLAVRLANNGVLGYSKRYWIAIWEYDGVKVLTNLFNSAGGDEVLDKINNEISKLTDTKV